MVRHQTSVQRAIICPLKGRNLNRFSGIWWEMFQVTKFGKIMFCCLENLYNCARYWKIVFFFKLATFLQLAFSPYFYYLVSSARMTREQRWIEISLYLQLNCLKAAIHLFRVQNISHQRRPEQNFQTKENTNESKVSIYRWNLSQGESYFWIIK